MKKTTSVKIQTPQPFNFDECLVYLNRSPLEKLHIVKDDSVTKLLCVDGKKILIQIHATQTALEIDFLNREPSEGIAKSTENYVTAWFDFHVDLTAYYKKLAQVKPFDIFVRDFSGLRMVKIHDLFQALCWAIIGQQVNIKFAYILFGRFIEAFGESLSHQNKTYWLFPKAEVITNIKPEDLQAMQFTRMKSEYIIHIAELIATGELSKSALLENGDFEAAKKRLVSIRGVGPWTANYVLMRCLGAPDAFPVEDVGLHNAIKILLGMKEKPSLDKVESIAKSVPGWSSYLAFYLYRSLL